MAPQRCLSFVLLMLLPLQVVAAEGHDSSATRESTADADVGASGNGAELDGTPADSAVVGLAARGESPAAFGRRCIPPGSVASHSNIPDILTRRASPVGRLAALGATPDFHHGLLGPEALVVWSMAKRKTTHVTRVAVLEMSPLGSVAVPAYRQAGLPLQLYATYIGAQVLDWGTTRVALRHGAVEANPIMLFAGAGGLGGMALKAATTLGVIHLIKRLGRKHPKVATTTLLALSAATAGMSVDNIQNIR